MINNCCCKTDPISKNANKSHFSLHEMTGKILLAFNCCTQLTIIRIFSEVGLTQCGTVRTLKLFLRFLKIPNSNDKRKNESPFLKMLVPFQSKFLRFSFQQWITRFCFFSKMLSFENNSMNKGFCIKACF